VSFSRLRPTANVARAIYGQILATAVLATLSEDGSASAGELFSSVAIGILVFWLAHVYSEAVAVRMERAESLRWPDVRRIAAQEWPLVQAALPMLGILLLGWVGVLSKSGATDLAIAFGVLALFGWGFVIGRRSRLSAWGTAAAVAVNGAFGLVILGLKVIVH
jgi:hypothetical protein